VRLVSTQRRGRCRICGIRTERVAFAEGDARITRRLRQVIGLDCQALPPSHAAVRHGIRWKSARRAEHACLREWDSQRSNRRPRHLGADEIHRGKAQKVSTVLSDLVHGDVIGLAKDRTEESLAGVLTTCLDAQQRAAVQAVCTDMHHPSMNAVARELSTAEIVFDTFPVLQHASAALDAVRRQEVFRAGAVLRADGRRTRWVLRRPWKTLRGSKRHEWRQRCAVTRRVFNASVLREPRDRLWTDNTRWGMARCLFGWLKALGWPRLPEMEKLSDMRVNHFDSIAASCDPPVRFRRRRVVGHDHQRGPSPCTRHAR
jgi:transposase